MAHSGFVNGPIRSQTAHNNARASLLQRSGRIRNHYFKLKVVVQKVAAPRADECVDGNGDARQGGAYEARAGREPALTQRTAQLDARGSFHVSLEKGKHRRKPLQLQTKCYQRKLRDSP